MTSAGCQKCLCELNGARVSDDGGFTCNPLTGQCTCIEGVTGANCSVCEDRWVLVNHVGCKRCDTCVHTLLDDVEELLMRTDQIEHGHRKNASLLLSAHGKLLRLEQEFEQATKLVTALEPSQLDSMPLVALGRTIRLVGEDLSGLKTLANEYDVSNKTRLLTRLLGEAELFNNREIGSLRIKLDLLDQIIDELDRADFKAVANVTDEQLNYYEGIVDQIVNKDLADALDKHRNLLEQFEKGRKST